MRPDERPPRRARRTGWTTCKQLDAYRWTYLGQGLPVSLATKQLCDYRVVALFAIPKLISGQSLSVIAQGHNWVMARVSTRTTECTSCGTIRPESLTTDEGPSSCPKCGSTARTVPIGLASELEIAGSLSLRMTARPREPKWEQHWNRIQSEFEALVTPRSTALGGSSVIEARDRLSAFFVEAYHLKDLLIVDELVSREQVESRINDDDQLSLLADLANLHKHGQLRNRRSGSIPSYGEASGVQRGDGEGGWRLDLPIHLGSAVLDGQTVASQAIDGWRRALVAWGLISKG